MLKVYLSKSLGSMFNSIRLFAEGSFLFHSNPRIKIKYSKFSCTSVTARAKDSLAKTGCHKQPFTMSKVDDDESRRSVSHRVFEPFNFSPDSFRPPDMDSKVSLISNAHYYQGPCILFCPKWQSL